MKFILNPEKGADIKGFLLNKRLYELKVGEKKGFEDDVGEALRKTYPFLEEVKVEGKFVCKFGDYANDLKVAVVAHEKGHKEGVEVEQGKEFITPQEIVDAEKKALFDQEGIPVGDGEDKDGVPWYGEGLTTDDEYIRPNRRRPGFFT